MNFSFSQDPIQFFTTDEQVSLKNSHGVCVSFDADLASASYFIFPLAKNSNRAQSVHSVWENEHGKSLKVEEISRFIAL